MAAFANASFLNSDVSAKALQGQSATSFATALAIGVAASSLQILGFVLLKDKIPKIYQPKSFLVPPRQRTSPLPPGAWQWIKPVFRRPDDDFLRRCGLDAYFLSRYLFVLLKILFPLSVLILPILLPIDGTGGNNKIQNVQGTSRNVTKGLDILTMSNIIPQSYDKFWAHCLLAVVVVVWTCYIILGELRFFIRVRQTFLTSPQHRLRASAATVLIRGLPKKYTDPDKIAALFDVYPGGIRNIWVNHDYHKLDKIIAERKRMFKELENAEAELILKCWKAYQKRLEEDKGGSVSSLPKADSPTDGHVDPNALVGEGMSANNPGQVHHQVDEAVEAINKLDVVDEERMVIKAPILGRGLDAVGQGLRDLRRGVGGGVDNIGKRLQHTASKRRKHDQDHPGEAEVTQTANGKIINREVVVPESISESDPNPYSQRASSTIERKDAPANAEAAQAVPPTRDESGRSTTPNSTLDMTYNLYYDEENHLDPRWRKFIDQKDRPVKVIKQNYKWLPKFMNPKTIKVDKIWHCRRELARLNRLIEGLQDPDAERLYPAMTSAFIQFNNQAAAHMAAQSVAHHTPTFMTPRLVEMSPNDVIWSNMSIPGWAQYLRKSLVFLASIGLLIIFTPLVAFSSAISQLDVIKKTPGFEWLGGVPGWGVAIIQGIVPIVLVNLLILAIGALLRLLVRRQGSPTRMRVELVVQKYFFIFSFIQYFIIVTVASAVPLVYNNIRNAINEGNVSIFLIPQLLAQNIPQASNYFLANILVQSLSQSAGGLFQPITLIVFAWQRTFNKTARSKFKSRTSLQNMMWGTTYPMYTTLACVAIIYSIISPLILPLSMIGFGIWWISTRYQMLYIFSYKIDTGGLLYPTAIKQLFTGLFVMELYLIGFFIVISTGSTSDDGGVSRGAIIPMAVVIVILLVGTVIFYVLLNRTFDPLLEYLPITLEDDAVLRDEAFAKLLQERHDLADEAELMQEPTKGGPEDHDDDQDSTQDGETSPGSQKEKTLDVEAQKSAAEGIKAEKAHLDPNLRPPNAVHGGQWYGIRKRSTAWSRNSSHNKSIKDGKDDKAPAQNTTDEDDTTRTTSEHRRIVGHVADEALNWAKPLTGPIPIVNPGQAATEAQIARLEAEADRLYGGIPDDLESLTVEQRDVLLSRAFKHKALRAKRPCVWLPRDQLGVSDDEIRNTALLTSYIWISNEKQQIQEKTLKLGYTGPPPDFDEVDLLQL